MRGFPCSLMGLCLWGWLWNQLPQNRIPLSVLICRVQPCVPLTLHSPDFQKALNFTGQMQCKLIFLLVAFLPSYLFSGEVHSRTWGKRGSWGNTCNPGAPSAPTHRVGSSSNWNPRISSEPGLGTRARGAGCGQLLAPQNSQGKMFSLWWGTAYAWVALLQNAPPSYSLGRVSDTC